MQLTNFPRLTAKQQNVYNFIKQIIDKDGVSPKISEIATFLEAKSLRTVTQILQALENKGLISRSRYQSRGIQLAESESQTVTVPVVSAAGCDNLSVFAQENYGEYISLDKNFLEGAKHKESVVIKAVGDSMKDANILSGDYVLVHLTKDVINGDIVCAVINGMAVIKKYGKTANAVVLSPMSDSSEYSPIIMKEDFEVLGKVIQIIKNPKNEEIVYVPES
jgi:repressor LexA